MGKTVVNIDWGSSADQNPLRKLLRGQVSLTQQDGIALVHSEEFRDLHEEVVEVLVDLEKRNETRRIGKKEGHYWELSDWLLWAVMVTAYQEHMQSLLNRCSEEEEEVTEENMGRMLEWLCLLAFLFEACRTRISWGTVSDKERSLLEEVAVQLPRDGVRTRKRSHSTPLRGSVPLPLRFLLLLHRQEGVAPEWYRRLAPQLSSTLDQQ